MAEISFAFGTSHGPLLSLPPEQWTRSRTADMLEIPIVEFKGVPYDYDSLLALRQSPELTAEATAEVMAEKWQRNQNALDALGEKLSEEKPDVIVIIGDDHMEFFKDDIQPMFAIYAGDAVTNPGFNPETDSEGLPDGVPLIISGHNPLEDQDYPIEKDLANAMIGQAIDDGFDITACRSQPKDGDALRGIGHSVGFIFRRILNDKPIPLVPVLMNTYFPPNQPPVKRCYEFGQSLGRAIRSWGEDKKVAVVASGGLSHFCVDEDWDNEILTALKERDVETLINTPESYFQSGSSEVKNWIALLGALDETGLNMDLVDYVPCYRTPAGTGTGTAFAVWS